MSDWGPLHDWRPWLLARGDELRASIAFLTRFPLPVAATAPNATLGQAAWAFPLAGVLVGVVGAVVYALAQRAGLPALPAAVLTVAATLAASGCLHEDGLADVADGFGGGATRERKLDIMRDSRIGTYGVCAVALSLLVRVSALASLGDARLVAFGLIAAQAGARAAVPVAMFLVPPARADGLSFTAGRPPLEGVAVAAVLGFLILAMGLGLGSAILALVVVAILGALVARLSAKQIGGQTGDVLGALEQVSEIAILLVAVG